MLDVNFEAVKTLASILVFGWDTSMNCKFSTKDKRAPHLRTDCPTAEEFLHFFAMLSPRPPFPALPGVARAAPPQIYKPSSDNHGGCKGKDCKALWMTPPFPGNTVPPSIRYETIDGKPLGEFRCYQEAGKPCTTRSLWFEGRLVRYYAPEGAYPIYKRAKELSGSEFIVINEGRAKIVVHPLHRDGTLRGVGKGMAIGDEP